MNIVLDISYAIGALAAVIVAFVIARSSSMKTVNKINEQNIKALQTQNGLQENEMKKQAAQIKDAANKISNLEGTVAVLRNIPLEKIEMHMADTNKILKNLISMEKK